MSKQAAETRIRKDEANARKRTERNRETIEKSLKQFGAARSIVIDKDGVVRAGNGTFEEAEKAGLKVRVIKGKPDELIAVQRDDWDESQATAYAIADNKTAELAEWDFEGLADHFREMTIELRDATGFADFEIEPILAADWVPPTVEDLPGLDTNDAGTDPNEGKHVVGFNDDQWDIVSQAVRRMREKEEAEDMAPGRVIELICGNWLAAN